MRKIKLETASEKRYKLVADERISRVVVASHPIVMTAQIDKLPTTPATKIKI